MPYSTELQRQKRAELRELRVQAEELEDQLAELQIIRQQLDVGLLHKRKPRSEIPLFQHNFCEEITEELANEVNNLYHETSAVLPAQVLQWDFLFKRLKSYCGSPSTTTTRKNTVNAVGYVDKKTSGPLDITSVWSLREGP
ncbi:hypothetical protein F441_02895 [Phytophthora nicotianae CJ01A1]|uniref:Uncharacterized protein n=1 Tax=Phytophthora nicotianae CJ01A1 TaxID=1317063 RepID=W2XN05_PHYNI|nr:hypothetical protein F441_02895 [Phytophthora nicotianae CJ01A1]